MPLIKSLENYHREWDEKKKIYQNKPCHDWSSHYCDSMRYLSEGLCLIQSARPSGQDEIKAINRYMGM